MILILDVETTFTDGDNTPYNLNNKLVSVGINSKYFFFYHQSIDESTHQETFNKIQKLLDDAKLIVGHNLKFDMTWMYHFGFKYNGKLYDTMLAEYISFRGHPFSGKTRLSLSLKECCRRRNLSHKFDSLKRYIDNNYNVDEIPIEHLEEYGRQDVKITYELYKSQIAEYKQKFKNLIKVRDMTNDFLRVLIDIELNGNCIHVDKLNNVEKNLTKEYYNLKQTIDNTVKEVMGDGIYNLSSGEDLSKIIYSRKLQDKNIWKEIFNIGTTNGKQNKRTRYKDSEFREYIKKYTDPIYKLIGSPCPTCHSTGYENLLKKDGTQRVRPLKCKDCKGEGTKYIETEVPAGFKYRPYSYEDATINGFKVDTHTLLRISEFSKGKLKIFADNLIKYSAVGKLLNTFVPALKDNVRQNTGLLHPSYNQTSTTTGRLSSSEPNFQNLPRDGGIKSVIISRFENGNIFEVDFSQLEFRTAVFLAQDKQGMKDIENGVDVHQNTADIIGCSRQEAKAHTFKPLYGGMMGNENERKYYQSFLKRYRDIAKWHITLQETAYKTKIISLPSGREYYFPDVYKTTNKYGDIRYTKATKIKNYPVQGFATADIVPIACLNVWSLMKEKGVKSLIINTVHDSIVIDTYPGEEKIVESIIKTGCSRVKDYLFVNFDCDFNVPLDIEIKSGQNWLDTKQI